MLYAISGGELVKQKMWSTMPVCPGDLNPIHWDDDIARKVGLEGPRSPNVRALSVTPRHPLRHAPDDAAHTRPRNDPRRPVNASR